MPNIVLIRCKIAKYEPLKRLFLNFLQFINILMLDVQTKAGILKFQSNYQIFFYYELRCSTAFIAYFVCGSH